MQKQNFISWEFTCILKRIDLTQPQFCRQTQFKNAQRQLHNLFILVMSTERYK